MNSLEVTISTADERSTPKQIQVARMVNLGMAGRNPPEGEELEKQLSQMNDAGVQTPESLPFVTPKPNYLLTTGDEIHVNSVDTAGEAEFVMYPTDEGIYIGVGNDHKMYEIASDMMHVANSTCPSVMSDEMWVYEEIADHWDEIELRSWIERDGELEPYQRAPLSAYMRPDDIVDAVADSITAPIMGTAIWSGTVGADGVDVFPEIISGDSYLVQLRDPVLNRRLSTRYDVHANNWITDIDLGE